MSTIESEQKKPFITSFISNMMALGIGLIIALIIAEVLTRIFLPVFPGKLKLDKDDNKLEVSDVQSGAVYRQYSEEFDAMTTITKDGYRIPEVKGNPDIVFIGDSFTYGQGLSDEETFVMQYCKTKGLSCMNLGVPGFGTIEELDRLEVYLSQYQIRPRKVYLVMLAMTSFLGAGNDLNDNLLVSESRQAQANGANENANKEKKNAPQSTVRQIADTAFKYSNLARVIKFYFFPIIKKAIVVEPDGNRLEDALLLTQKQLLRLDELSKQHAFDYQILLIHPVQDISRGTFQDTIDKVQAISPVPIISSAKLLENDPNQYYFAMDGHFNKKGSDKMVELLLSLDKGNTE